MRRIIDISNPAHVSYSLNRLMVRQPSPTPEVEPTEIPVPLEDVGVLLLNHPQITITQKALEGCASEQVAVLICDEKRLPRSLLLDFQANSLHARIARAQVAASEPRRKRAWQQIIQAKIRAQHSVLTSFNVTSPLATLVDRVRSGDPDNVEARAARAYWPRLLGADFIRNPAQDGVNSLLNYGYAVVRACVARAVASAGLHPAFGLHHSNQYNPFALADDLMEPLRPAVDRIVRRLQEDGHTDIDRTTKTALLQLTQEDYELADGCRYPLHTALERYAASCVRCLTGEAGALVIPSLG